MGGESKNVKINEGGKEGKRKKEMGNQGREREKRWLEINGKRGGREHERERE